MGDIVAGSEKLQSALRLNREANYEGLIGLKDPIHFYIWDML